MNRTSISIAIACLVAASPAHAHFKLNAPANWTTIRNDGGPQKTPPCGNEGNPTDNGPVTEYMAGSTISISIDETTFHPGHYRVSLAANQASLPPDPDGDVVGASCGSLAIDPNPTLPLLADGLLVHTRAFTSQQTMQVTLPAGMTCDSCVLQVVEFMSSHGAPCFYHHCAKIKISVDGPPPGSGPDAGGDDGGGGGCQAGGAAGGGAALLVLAAGLVRVRRRRR